MAKKSTTPRRKVKVAPTADKPIPYDDTPQVAATHIEELQVAAATAEALQHLGALPNVDAKTLHEEKELLEKAVTQQPRGDVLPTMPSALGAQYFLKRYGQSLGMDIGTIRAALTNKLLEIADCGDIKHELRAIELLGKHSDVGLFTERSEININFNSPEALEAAIKERVKRLLSAETVYELPSGLELEEELSVIGDARAEFEAEQNNKAVEAEFEEVEDADDQDTK